MEKGKINTFNTLGTVFLYKIFIQKSYLNLFVDQNSVYTEVVLLTRLLLSYY